MHTSVFVKEPVTKKVKRACKLCSQIYLQLFDEHQYFGDIIIDERDFTQAFNKFFYKRSLFSLDICHNHKFFINAVKAKHFDCTQFLDIRTPKGLFIFYLSILIRLY